MRIRSGSPRFVASNSVEAGVVTEMLMPRARSIRFAAAGSTPFPLAVTTGPVPVTIPQVWRWRSVDADGVPVSLGTCDAGGTDCAELVLSPGGNDVLRGACGSPLCFRTPSNLPESGIRGRRGART